MQADKFKEMVDSFIASDIDDKINMYLAAEGLTQEQYKELLRHFPLGELHRLEAALG